MATPCRVKVIGAGSIGNHLAQASRRMGWDVVVIDRDPEALRRMKEEIYPKRYGAWDEAIQLFTSDQEPKGGFDVIFLGTPPDVRMKLALSALMEKPRVLLLEKPLCSPTLDGLDEFLAAYKAQTETSIIMGYDHAISPSITEVYRLIEEGSIGDIETLDVEFREHWQGIFNAHPWLSGPQDTYLGFWARGGGASGEHSHAMHLWYNLARKAGFGRWKTVSSAMELVQANGAEYDTIAAFQFVTDKGKIGRVVQDVVTHPVRKWARIQGKKGFIEWVCNGHATGDVVRSFAEGGEVVEQIFEKKRPDDFYRETMHIQDILDGKTNATDSPISFESGVEVMRVLNAAHAHRNETASIASAF